MVSQLYYPYSTYGTPLIALIPPHQNLRSHHETMNVWCITTDVLQPAQPKQTNNNRPSTQTGKILTWSRSSALSKKKEWHTQTHTNTHKHTLHPLTQSAQYLHAGRKLVSSTFIESIKCSTLSHWNRFTQPEGNVRQNRTPTMTWKALTPASKWMWCQHSVFRR